MVIETVGVFCPVLARCHPQARMTPGWRVQLSASLVPLLAPWPATATATLPTPSRPGGCPSTRPCETLS